MHWCHVHGLIKIQQKNIENKNSEKNGEREGEKKRMKWIEREMNNMQFAIKVSVFDAQC